MKVIVVEATWEFRNEFENDLKLIGCKLACVQQAIGNEGVLSRFKPDIIIWNRDLKLFIEDFRAIRKIENLENVHLVATGSNIDQSTIGMAFDEGADDYFVTTLDKSIIIKKLQAITRKIYPQYLDKCGLKLDSKSLVAIFKDREIVLTKTHFNLLFELLKNYPEIAHRQDLNKNVLKDVVVTERTIDVHICALRKVLKPLKFVIESNRSLGYRLKLGNFKQAQEQKRTA